MSRADEGFTFEEIHIYVVLAWSKFARYFGARVDEEQDSLTAQRLEELET